MTPASQSMTPHVLVRVQAVKLLRIPRLSQGVYCKLALADAAASKSVAAWMQATVRRATNHAPTCFYTQTAALHPDPSSTQQLWGEALALPLPVMNSAMDEVLVIHVKNSGRLHDAELGKCVIPLASLHRDETVHKHVSLWHGGQHVGMLRLTMKLEDRTEREMQWSDRPMMASVSPRARPFSTGARPGRPLSLSMMATETRAHGERGHHHRPPSKTQELARLAREANQAADEAVDRLLAHAAH